MTECKNFMCGSCRIVQYPEMFGESRPPDADGVIWAGEMVGNEESMMCTRKEVCKEYEPKEDVMAVAKD